MKKLGEDTFSEESTAWEEMRAGKAKRAQERKEATWLMVFVAAMPVTTEVLRSLVCFLIGAGP